VFVAGLPFNVDWQELKRYFKPAGQGPATPSFALLALPSCAHLHPRDTYVCPLEQWCTPVS
jgi:hypothetical protein